MVQKAPKAPRRAKRQEELKKRKEDLAKAKEEENKTIFTQRNITIFGIWLVLQLIFAYLEFGTIFLIISIAILIYMNTSTAEKDPEKKSAYSVFNKNCERLDGQITTATFEKQIYSR
ncbi:hypothetical protein H8356DRAFT_1696284 [Neocallimastix lanati (nom. inval.)]|uniref:SAYSvFN domain-containing protein n=1 Tax=Neocallimastix californiae TaxID=1754190 RepID=A0A1Y1Z7T6_9FUNG|nr:hypothetical protein H8356DRAFT_1696284 [Neocallimastix sp. JGI-2020a]ORY06057.1 hypothetical protein LY90DRAFT_678406 [Neocallimastix californiae]|eukprot:ORY06057.1 hypothetical protein LY90DRAFT_678406 [Neocallimastix californiae]